MKNSQAYHKSADNLVRFLGYVYRRRREIRGIPVLASLISFTLPLSFFFTEFHLTRKRTPFPAGYLYEVKTAAVSVYSGGGGRIKREGEKTRFYRDETDTRRVEKTQHY